MASVVGAYARAFADVVVGHKLDPARLQQELLDFGALLQQSAPLRLVMENPSIPGDRKLAVLDSIVQRLGLTPQARNFIAVITDHRRLALFSDIVKQVAVELNERLGFVDAEVVSARELSAAERQWLEADLSRLTGKKVRAHYRQDPALLGGARIQVGSTIYDGSVSGQLEKIREQLVS